MVQKLREIRKKRGLTQKKLAELSRVPRICISRYEAGKYHPGLENASKLAAALGVTVDELIGKAG